MPAELRAFRRPALVVGHPGHELIVFGWVAESRPHTYIITDGSGRQSPPRTASSARCLHALEAQKGEVFAPLSDADIYRAMRERDASPFLQLLDSLVDSFVKHEIDLVAGDAAEGFNPTHDVCRSLIDAAAVMLERKTGQTIANYEFDLAEWAPRSTALSTDTYACLWLDEALFRKKIEAAEANAELQFEVSNAMAKHGEAHFRKESLRKVVEPRVVVPFVAKPYYEQVGEERVKSGAYGSVLRYREHVLPIMRAIRDHALTA